MRGLSLQSPIVEVPKLIWSFTRFLEPKKSFSTYLKQVNRNLSIPVATAAVPMGCSSAWGAGVVSLTLGNTIPEYDTLSRKITQLLYFCGSSHSMVVRAKMTGSLHQGGYCS